MWSRAREGVLKNQRYKIHFLKTAKIYPQQEKPVFSNLKKKAGDPQNETPAKISRHTVCRPALCIYCLQPTIAQWSKRLTGVWIGLVIVIPTGHAAYGSYSFAPRLWRHDKYNIFVGFIFCQQSTPLAFPDGFQSIQRFNQYILDICDSLWRNKAFIDREKSFCFSIPRLVIYRRLHLSVDTRKENMF